MRLTEQVEDKKDAANLDLAQAVVREHVDKPQVDASHYGHAYNTKNRLASYWHQIEEVLKFQPQSALEVGIGAGYTSAALRQNGVAVVTMDVAADLLPSIVGSVRTLPFRDRSIDVSVCCQVLEHLPFEEFTGSVRELYRVAKKGMVISLPDCGRCMGLTIGSFQRIYFQKLIPMPRTGRPYINPQHFWEINDGKISLEKVKAAIREATGKTPKTYRVVEFAYHHFFVVDR